MIYVDDGSSDGSVGLIEGWIAERSPVVLVQLSRNYGMEIAMSAGIDAAGGDWVVLLHADLQDPPELIPQMLELADEGADVVYARRIGRDESAVKRGLATIFYKLMERLARVPYQGQAGDFRLMSRRVVDAMQRMPERRRFLRGMVAWTGYRQVPIEYSRAGRAHGRGASYPDLVRLALEALTAYSDVPLSIATLVGSVVAVISGITGLVIAVLAAAGAVESSASLFVLLAPCFSWAECSSSPGNHRPLPGPRPRGVAGPAAVPAVGSGAATPGARHLRARSVVAEEGPFVALAGDAAATEARRPRGVGSTRRASSSQRSPSWPTG